MSRRPLPSPATDPGKAPNADLAALSRDALAVEAARCDAALEAAWQEARRLHVRIDGLHARREAALRLRSKLSRSRKGEA